MNEQETTADIIADMRGGPIPQHRHDRVLLLHFADRLEAAYKREINALTEELDTAKHCWKVWSDRADELLSKCNAQSAKLKTLGDATKLREALEELVANIEMRSSTFGLNVMVDTKTYLDAKAALANTSSQTTQGDKQ